MLFISSFACSVNLTQTQIRTKITVTFVFKLQIKKHTEIVQEVVDLEAQLVKFRFTQ